MSQNLNKMTEVQFLQGLADKKMKNQDRAVGLLWFISVGDVNSGLKNTEIDKFFSDAGYGKQNITRLKNTLKKDPRVVSGTGGIFKINQKHRTKLDSAYKQYSNCLPIPISSSVLPIELFDNTKNYVIKVVDQLNASYDYSLFDCCAVMCRRLLETLIIEVYESQGRSIEIKDNDGNFLMFSGLLKYLEKDAKINISRNCLSGLKKFKKLGDLSAHNRRFNAGKNDIDRIRDEIRIASQELINLI